MGFCFYFGVRELAKDTCQPLCFVEASDPLDFDDVLMLGLSVQHFQRITGNYRGFRNQPWCNTLFHN